MKTFKYILLGCLVAHIAFMLIIGFTSFTEFKDDQEAYSKLNPTGQKIVDYSSFFKCSEAVTDFIYCYSIFTGTNRGYSFFSPNVTQIKVDIAFMANDKKIELPLLTQESKLKFGCANLHFKSNIFNVEERELILKSISSYLFSANPDIEKLDVYLNLSRYMDLETAKSLGYKVAHKSILGFSATKHQKIAKN
ncbi:hypothetical protein [uncultured Tenacibaculum sp.]|uniref:hypothetical protein n=1 Tax=uncultured Tenacibaculum sp. TaxID=174713 RepID=UPI002622F485|nr:hypothetical protein [uncultured Tenacibaculum sp.]